MNEQILSESKKFLKELVQASGDLIRPYFLNHSLHIERKGDLSPVTEADKGAEQLMRDMIMKRFPSHGILGEEFGTHQGDADFVWVLDPIDGTISFTNGCPLFVTLIGLLYEGKPILGCIHQPVLQQTVIGDNQTCTYNDMPCRVKDGRKLSQATVLTSDLSNIAKYQPASSFTHLQSVAQVTRTWGDGYGYLLVATGWADVMIDPIMNPWDFLPLIPVIQGAGGVITDWKGKDAAKGDSCIAANMHIHSQVMASLSARSLD